MLELEDMQDTTDSNLENFADSLTHDEEPPFHDFRHLTVWSDWNSWIPYRWKIC